MNPDTTHWIFNFPKNMKLSVQIFLTVKKYNQSWFLSKSGTFEEDQDLVEKPTQTWAARMWLTVSVIINTSYHCVGSVKGWSSVGSCQVMLCPSSPQFPSGGRTLHQVQVWTSRRPAASSVSLTLWPGTAGVARRSLTRTNAHSNKYTWEE